MIWFLQAMAFVFFLDATLDIVTSRDATANLALSLALMVAAGQLKDERRN